VLVLHGTCCGLGGRDEQAVERSSKCQPCPTITITTGVKAGIITTGIKATTAIMVVEAGTAIMGIKASTTTTGIKAGNTCKAAIKQSIKVIGETGAKGGSREAVHLDESGNGQRQRESLAAVQNVTQNKSANPEETAAKNCAGARKSTQKSCLVKSWFG
jgi:hypothetical protein